VTSDGFRFAKAVLNGAGIDVAIGYGTFLVIALFVSLMGASAFMGMKVTLADLLSGDAAGAALGDGSGRGVLLVLLATASIAVPFLWKHRFAPLAYAVPLLFTALAFRPLYQEHRAQKEALKGLGELGLAAAQMAERLGAPSSPLDAMGIGAWLLFATVIFLAFKGVLRCFERNRAGSR
jgi:hypothetical protein